MKIFSASDDAKRKRMASVVALVRALSVQAAQRGRIAFPWDGRSVAGPAVEAFIDRGRWLAQCDNCGSHEYVDPDTPIFFCMNCGNGDNRAARPVLFPEERERIELALVAREVLPGFGRDEIERTMNGVPIVEGLWREWRPGISADELEAQNLAVIGDQQPPIGGEEVSDGLQ